ncbi:tyrosine-protein phosphatase YwqE [Abditibacteriota bacterium]|nr:tyrosine-protein phosphatase YwqE [Abditibacteriota bacterium]
METSILARYDLHCHALPEWDDGPDSLDDSLALLERAQNAGTQTLVATPHVGRRWKHREEHQSSDIPGAVERLNNAAQERGLTIRVVPGAELLMGAIDIGGAGEVKDSWTYGSKKKWALIESPGMTWPTFANHIVYELARRGVRSVLAHPERYVDVQKDANILQTALSQGAAIQVTAGVVSGQMNDKNMIKCVHNLFKLGLVHLVASDAHMASHTMPGEVVEEVVARVGEARARQIFEDNPRAVLEGTSIPSQYEVAPTAPSGGGFWSRLRGK